MTMQVTLEYVATEMQAWMMYKIRNTGHTISGRIAAIDREQQKVAREPSLSKVKLSGISMIIF